MKKKRTIIFLCIILLLAAVFCLTAFRVRGSVSVKGEGSTQSPDPVFFSQKDPFWAGDLLGDSSFTMETSGCLTACLAAELHMQDISIPEINAMDPGTLNSFFSGKQVYDREGNIQWDPLSSALNVSCLLYTSGAIPYSSICSLPSRPRSFSTSSSTGSPWVSHPAFLGTIYPFMVR